jgi:hypothetical protein
MTLLRAEEKGALSTVAYELIVEYREIISTDGLTNGLEEAQVVVHVVYVKEGLCQHFMSIE